MRDIVSKVCYVRDVMGPCSGQEGREKEAGKGRRHRLGTPGEGFLERTAWDWWPAGRQELLGLASSFLRAWEVVSNLRQPLFFVSSRSFRADRSRGPRSTGQQPRVSLVQATSSDSAFTSLSSLSMSLRLAISVSGAEQRLNAMGIFDGNQLTHEQD